MSRTANVDELVERAGRGEPRAVARLVSLIEDASPVLREVTAALAPYTGRALRGRVVRRILRGGAVFGRYLRRRTD